VAGVALVPPVAFGTAVTYTMAVTNEGNVPLSSVRVDDPLCAGGSATYGGGDANNNGLLDLTETWSYFCAYTVTQTDVDTGSRDNKAWAYGTHGGVTVDDDDDYSFTTLQTKTVEVTKTPSLPADLAGFVLDEVVTYTLKLKNTGTVTLSSPVMADPLCSAPPTLTGKSLNADNVLDPGEIWTWTCTYTIIQSDVDRGKVDNTATGSGLPPGKTLDVDRVSGTASATVTTVSTGDLSLTKGVSNPSTGLVAGNTVLYTVKATNTGTTTLSNISVTDPLCPAAAPLPVNRLTYTSGDVGLDGKMSPGEVWTYGCAYTVPQTDVDTMSKRTNTATSLATPVPGATVTGLTPGGQLIRTATADITFNQDPRIDVTKTGDRTVGALGTPVLYTMKIKNTGTVTLTDRTLVDPLCQPVLSPDTELSPGEEQSYTCTRSLTQADVDAGSVVNTVTGTAKFGNTTVTDMASWTVTAARTPAIGITKSAAPTSGLEAGDPVVYSLSVTNTGNVSLTAVTVTDPLCSPTPTGGDVANPGVLDLPEVWTFTCTYTVTQSDVEAGAIVNVATASGTGAGQTVTKTATATVTTLQTPAIVVDKTATAASGTGAGDPVLYTVVVKNGGNVPLSDITVTDPLCTLVAQSGDTNGDGVLQLSETWTFTCTYVVTQADVDAGKRDNTATGTGTWKGTPVTDTGSATVPLRQTPVIVVDKTADPANGVKVGDVVTYTLLVSNGGNVTLSDLKLADPLCAPVLQSGDANADGKLQVGEVWRYTCTYTVTQVDVDAGEIQNTATATAVFGTTPLW
jgi:uncharacterized repeat protein (TIGR01451 family)